MSRGTADNRATADDALMRYADILDGRKRLVEDRGRSTRHGASRFYFYKSRNGLLPPEIESPFAEACDEIRRCGNVALANIVTLLHEDLAAKFSATALLYQEAAQLEREGDRISKRQEEAYRRKEEKRVEFLNDLLRDCPENIWDLPTDQISEAWRKVEEAKREAEARAHDMFHEELDFDPYLDLEICLDERFSPSLKSLEECFERNATAIRSITKTGLKDRRDEKLDQIIAAICLGNQTQAETKKAVVGVRDDVRELKPEIVRGANAAESADANAAAAKTAAEGAKTAAKDTHGLLSSFLAAAPEWLKRAVSRISFGKDPLYRARRKAVCDKWLEFKGGECDTERPDGTLRTAGGKRDYKEFREAYRDVVVFNGKTLGTLYPDGEGYPEDESYWNLEKDIGGEGKRRKRAERKKPS